MIVMAFHVTYYMYVLASFESKCVMVKVPKKSCRS
ncbi:hypothetical protein [Cronobacter phage JC01]|uniref:Uncharacterized protein n=1 Tax=Cronobacter phage JC01 TaxID=2729575 RepID=A0A6M3YKZ1_9CAUD|nr:hypothetical protein JT331_gp01 [Cronobacter phage JC01]QJI52222.1 hypothetical protein [Cronobacter phage JC01]